MYAALALNALGLSDQIDTDAILANLNAYLESYGEGASAGTVAKYLMALTAGGYDCTELVATMEALETGSESVYSLVFILAVYDYGGYTVGSDAAWTLDGLIDAIIESIYEDGLIGSSYEWGGVTYTSTDTQTSAQAILALIPYMDDEDVAAAVEVLVAGIAANQNADGGYSYSAGYASDADATANIVAALAALGYDTTDAVAWLVSQADSTLDGYVDYGSADESMTSATVFMALAAYQVAPTSVYELYTVAASTDTTESTESTTDSTETTTEGTAESTETTESTTEDSSEALAATGDGALAMASLTCSFAVVLCGAGLALRRRRTAMAPARRHPASRR